jgi:hypothetical protein
VLIELLKPSPATVAIGDFDFVRAVRVAHHHAAARCACEAPRKRAGFVFAPGTIRQRNTNPRFKNPRLMTPFSMVRVQHVILKL